MADLRSQLGQVLLLVQPGRDLRLLPGRQLLLPRLLPCVLVLLL